MPTAPWYGWHVLQQPDQINRHPFTPVTVGVPIHARGHLSPHTNGLHATPDILYALGNTTGIWYCRVQLLGRRRDEADQSCARTRVVWWMVDATPLLLRWTFWVARRALLREQRTGRVPHPLLWTALARVRQYPGPGRWEEAHTARVDVEHQLSHEVRRALDERYERHSLVRDIVLAGFFVVQEALLQATMAGHPPLHPRTIALRWDHGPQGLGSGGLAASAAMWAQQQARCLAYSHGEDGEVAARREAAWQRRLLETMLFRAAGKPVEHWRPPVLPLPRPFTAIPRDLRRRASKDYLAGMRFDLLPPEGRRQMQRLHPYYHSCATSGAGE